MVESCYVTGGLLDGLLALAADREPESVSTLLAVTRAGALVDERGLADSVAVQPTDPSEIDPGTPVFTDFYVPSAARSVDAVFGVDVSVPHGQAQGRFVSHPLGELDVSTTDDLHEVVLVAVPPWSRADVGAFDRGGRRLALEIVAGAPPERSFDESGSSRT